MKTRSYLYSGLTTTLNIVLFIATFGRFIWLEGRVRNGVFRNWIRRFRYRPIKFVEPASEEQIIYLVKNAGELRVFGAGHSFNDGVVADHTLMSLDKFSGIIRKDLANKQIAFKGGTRVRKVTRLLLEHGLAFRALPSHDAQSIGGILSTDVHGTGGHDWGFVSQLVKSIKLVDGKGDLHECRPADDLFKAAIGGIGAVGIITEVVVEAVDRFKVEQKTEISNLSYVKGNLDRLLSENDHLSLYLFPFTDKCQINSWNHTKEKQSFLGPLREFVSISLDALLAAWVGNFLAYSGLLPKLSSMAHSLKRGTNLVLESNAAFNRTIYHLHQELEFTVPYEYTFDVARRTLELYEQMYHQGLPYTILEVRFTPAGHDRTFIGAGRGRRSTWLDLLTNDTRGFEEYYAAIEALMKEIGARPHLGKFCHSFGQADMERLHGENFAKFIQLVDKHDPENKFANDFTRRLFRD